MNARTSIINASGDYEENLERLAKHLKKDSLRRSILTIIYGRGSRPKSKKQIAECLGISGSLQPLQNALEYMANHHLITRTANDGAVTDRSKHLYSKDEFVRVNRNKIVALADDPKRMAGIATKRKPAVEVNVSFVRTRSTAARSKANPNKVVGNKKKTRIALLVTNPERHASLQTGVEARDIQKAIISTGNSDQVDVKVFLAPTFDDLIDSLNQYSPHILHFSGHGGGETLLFDNQQAGQDGGAILDFDLIARLLETTSSKPNLLVLAACDTMSGADRFLRAVPAVIAMTDSIDDEAACEFSARFYKSIASNATIASALAQAKLLLEHKGFDDADLPQLITANQSAQDKTFL